MSEKNKAILEEANAAIAEGNYEGFLSCCADNTKWTFVGDKTLKGKEAVRQWMATTYVEPPKFMVANLIAEGDFVTALGDITMKDEDGKAAHYSYCDIWRFRGGKIVELRAFVIKTEVKDETSSAASAAGDIAKRTKQRNTMRKPEFFVTPGYGEYMLNRLHYSQAVKIDNRVETSGQGGIDDNLQIPEAFADEIAQAFRNVERTLATAGAGWEHVVHVNSYHVGGFPPEVNDVMVRLYRHYMPNHAPIWTQVGVAALGLPTMRIEIRVTAIIA